MRYTILAFSLFFLLAGCGKPRPVLETAHDSHPVVVVGKCVDNPPAPVTSLRDRISREDWQNLTPRQKVAHLGIQGKDRWDYGDGLAAATARCR